MNCSLKYKCEILDSFFLFKLCVRHNIKCIGPQEEFVYVKLLSEKSTSFIFF